MHDVCCFCNNNKNDTQTVENPVAMIEASLVLYFLSLYISFVISIPTAVLPMKEATASTAERPGVLQTARIRGRRNWPAKSIKP